MRIRIVLTVISLMCFSLNKVNAQKADFSKYPSTVISNNEVSMKLYLPDAKKGIYRATRFDWSGLIGSVQYKGHEYFGPWNDSHDPLRAADVVGPAESSKDGGLGYDEALPGGKFIRLGVGIIQKGDEPQYDQHIETYKILDHGKWKIDKGDDWITFTHTIKSDFGYSYVYEKTVRLNEKGFHIEHRLQNTGEKKIEIDQYNHNFFVIDNQISGPSFKVKYPFGVKTTNDTKGLVKVAGLDIEFLKDFEKGESVFVELEGFKPSVLHNKFSIENTKTGAGVLVSIDQPITRAQFWAKNTTLCPEHFIQLSIEPNKEQTWTSKYILFESKPAKQVDYSYSKVEIEPEVLSIIEEKWKDEFKHVEYPQQFLDKVIIVNPGDDIQSAIDEAHASGGGVVALKEGTYILKSTLTLKSKVTIIGAGKAQTVLLQGPEMKGTCFSAGAEPQVTDVVIKDMTLRGTRTGNANGILMTGRNESRHTRIMLQNITVADWSQHGIHIKRTDNIIMDKCDIQYNGSAGGLYHNVYFLYNKYLLQSDCDMSFPVKGKGNKYTSFEYVIAQRCTIRDCKGNGIQADHEEAGYFFFHKYNISGCGNAAFWFPCEHYYDKYNYTEDPKYAPQNVIINRCEIIDNAYGAMWRKVGGAYIINSTFDSEQSDMVLYKCGVTMENSKFLKGNEEYTDIDQWPQDVSPLW
ncbi:MAG TPA: glycosyl hydrolase family 28-related protein [Bacteroidales bacterium]|nr:glycosyl hydrolase family 28-related protein [Bacteroidales bacterium]